MRRTQRSTPNARLSLMLTRWPRSELRCYGGRRRIRKEAFTLRKFLYWKQVGSSVIDPFLCRLTYIPVTVEQCFLIC